MVTPALSTTVKNYLCKCHKVWVLHITGWINQLSVKKLSRHRHGSAWGETGYRPYSALDGRDWLIYYDGVRLRLRTADTNGSIVHPLGDMWAWRAMVMMVMPAGDRTRLVHQSSLAVLPAETSGASRKNWRSEKSAYQYLKYLKGSLTCCKISRHRTYGFTSHPKEGVLRIFIAVKDPSPLPGLNLRPLGPVASTLTSTPPRRRMEVSGQRHALAALYPRGKDPRYPLARRLGGPQNLSERRG
jgi:hypothetical protein